MAATARKATFAPNPRRRAMLAKIHLASKELGYSDDDYRAVMFRITRQLSAKDCTDAQLDALLDELKAKGFKPKARKAVADHPVAKKARALWISLYHLGAVQNPAEEALEAFAKRQLGVERLQWANQAQGYKLIEALKNMAEREGWDQSLDHLTKLDSTAILLKRLVITILGKLKAKGIAHASWTLDQAAWSLAGMEKPSGDLASWTTGELETLARALGDLLRNGGARS